MRYVYTGAARIEKKIEALSGATSFLFSTVIAVGVPAIAALGGDPRSALNLLCMSVWALLVGWTGGVVLLNGHPDVWIDDDYLTISAFLFARIRIPWADVVDLHDSGWPIRRTVVRTRKITPFHRLVGWYYGRTVLPSFVIRPSIEDYESLVRIIAERSQSHAHSS